MSDREPTLYLPSRDLGGKAEKWGGRSLLSNDPALLNRPNGQQRQKVTLIQIADMGRPRQVNIQMRWAPVVAANNPTPELPFTFDCRGGVNRYLVTVRRTVDRQAGPIEDQFEIFIGDTLPIDIVLCRELTVEIEAMTLGTDGQGWVECAASLVSNPGPRNLWYPYDVVNTQRFQATSAAGLRLIPANKDRFQFTICNTSTDADLAIGFASPLPLNAVPPVPVWPTTNIAFVLPRGGFFVYESPTQAVFKGNVMGVWSGAGNGGALIMEGTIF